PGGLQATGDRDTPGFLLGLRARGCRRWQDAQDQRQANQYPVFREHADHLPCSRTRLSCPRLSDSRFDVITITATAMSVSEKSKAASWLLLVFTLPAAKASARVGVWRKLQRYGAIALPASGYVLPNSAMNYERFEWLAASIRGSKGQAAVAQVRSFDQLKSE